MANFKDKLARAFPVWSDMLERPKSIIDQTIVAGAAAGDLTVTGIKPGDELVSVLDITGTDLTSEFTITGDDTINNDGGTSSDTNQVIVTWVKYAE